jgi:hypothetical protein
LVVMWTWKCHDPLPSYEAPGAACSLPSEVGAVSAATPPLPGYAQPTVPAISKRKKPNHRAERVDTRI